MCRDQARGEKQKLSPWKGEFSRSLRMRSAGRSNSYRVILVPCLRSDIQVLLKEMRQMPQLPWSFKGLAEVPVVQQVRCPA